VVNHTYLALAMKNSSVSTMTVSLLPIFMYVLLVVDILIANYVSLNGNMNVLSNVFVIAREASETRSVTSTDTSGKSRDVW